MSGSKYYERILLSVFTLFSLFIIIFDEPARMIFATKIYSLVSDKV